MNKKAKTKRTYRKKKLWLARDCNRYRIYQSVNPPVFVLCGRMWFNNGVDNVHCLYGFCVRDFDRFLPQFKLKSGQYRELVGSHSCLIAGDVVRP